MERPGSYPRPGNRTRNIGRRGERTLGSARKPLL